MKLGLKLGSDPFAHGALALDKYVDTATAPAVPETVATPDSTGYQWGMLDNDRYGDCVAAAMFHCDESFYLRRNVIPTPYAAAEVLTAYFAMNGVPAGPPGSSSDQGTDPSVAMKFWVDAGLPGHKLAGFGQMPAN